MGFYQDDLNQIKQSWILKDDQRALLSIRVILFLIVDAVWWCQIYYSGSINFLNLIMNLQYLTMWGLNLLHFYLIFAIFEMVYYLIKQRNIQCLWKLQYFMFQFGFATSLTIFLLFWTGVYPNLSESEKNDRWLMFLNTADHGIIFVVYYIEYIINNIIFKWKQFYLTLLACIIYMIINMIITFSYEKVYSIIDWVSLFSYLCALISFLITLFHFWVGIKLYQKFKHNKICQAQLSNAPTITNIQLPVL